MALAGELAKPYFSKGLQGFLEGEWGKGAKVFPPRPLIFRALNTVPLDQVRFRILLMYSFAVHCVLKPSCKVNACCSTPCQLGALSFCAHTAHNTSLWPLATRLL